jgi:hypothetical protein
MRLLRGGILEIYEVRGAAQVLVPAPRCIKLKGDLLVLDF